MGHEQVIAAVVLADGLLEQYHAAITQLGKDVKRGRTEDFSRQIGEANGLYEGVWDQLDHARSLLSAGGVEVPGYDQARAAQGHTTKLGVLDAHNVSGVDLAGSVMRGGIRTVVDVSVEFNLAGAAAAKSCSFALKSALPHVDWAAEERKREAKHVELRGGFKTARLVVIALGIALVVWFVVKLTG